MPDDRDETYTEAIVDVLSDVMKKYYVLCLNTKDIGQLPEKHLHRLSRALREEIGVSFDQDLKRRLVRTTKKKINTAYQEPIFDLN